MTEHLLVAEGISVSFHRMTVLEDVNITLRTGKITGLVGPSGCGKTTLLRVLAGLHHADAGTVHYDGSTTPPRGSIALLAQHPRLVCNPRWTLDRIIAEPARIRGTDLSVRETADQVGLDTELLQRYPAQVSDGQLQRACIARILVQSPRFLLCDEPTAMLDPIATAAMTDLLQHVCTNGVAIALVSHSHAVVSALATSVITLTPDASSFSMPGA
jgi:peptide/nickel transport system ATP-binding protein